jgi:hypothetical protein
VSDKGEARRLLGELETLVNQPGYDAMRQAITRKQEGVHRKALNAGTTHDQRAEAAAEWRAYEEVLTLPERTMNRLRAEIEAGGE